MPTIALETSTKAAATSFEQEVLAGLTATEKYISSKYFYDANGAHIFSDITRLPEYYLTGCEQEILTNHARQIANSLAPAGEPLAIVELGAGDAQKTRILLRHMVNQHMDVHYMPVDIVPQSIETLKQLCAAEFNGHLPVKGIVSDFLEQFPDVSHVRDRRRVFMLLGSSIGNYHQHEAVALLKRMRRAMTEDDLAMIGFDLVKNPATVLAAYNDAQGVTRAFNHNLLHRINQELDANFRVHKFQHFPIYDPVRQQARSYLISTENQVVILGKLNTRVYFRAGEAIHTEISQKFDLTMINQWLGEAGLELCDLFTDSRRYFADVVVRAV